MQFQLTWLVFISISCDSHVHVSTTCRFTTWLFSWFTGVLGYFRPFWFHVFWEAPKHIPCRWVTCDYELCPISVASFCDTHLLGAYPDYLSEVASLWGKSWITKAIVFDLLVPHVHRSLTWHFISFGWNEEIYRRFMLWKEVVSPDLFCLVRCGLFHVSSKLHKSSTSFSGKKPWERGQKVPLPLF